MAKHLNVTNREVIKSKSSYKEEALALLENLRQSQSRKNLKVDLQSHIKKEVSSMENGLGNQNVLENLKMGNLNSFLNNYRRCINNGPFPGNNLLNFCPNAFPNVPFNSLNFWLKNINNNLRK